MARKISISISDYVDDEIIKRMDYLDKTNKSEFIEELIRIGLLEQRLIEDD